MTEMQDGYDLSHYIVFEHRNHLPVMSATKPTLPNATAYDFTSSSAMAFGTDALVALPSSSLLEFQMEMLTLTEELVRLMLVRSQQTWEMLLTHYMILTAMVEWALQMLAG